MKYGSLHVHWTEERSLSSVTDPEDSKLSLEALLTHPSVAQDLWTKLLGDQLINNISHSPDCPLYTGTRSRGIWVPLQAWTHDF